MDANHLGENELMEPDAARIEQNTKGKTIQAKLVKLVFTEFVYAV